MEASEKIMYSEKTQEAGRGRLRVNSIISIHLKSLYTSFSHVGEDLSNLHLAGTNPKTTLTDN